MWTGGEMSSGYLREGNPEVLIGQRWKMGWDICWGRNGRIPDQFQMPFIYTNSF